MRTVIAAKDSDDMRDAVGILRLRGAEITYPCIMLDHPDQVRGINVGTIYVAPGLHLTDEWRMNLSLACRLPGDGIVTL